MTTEMIEFIVLVFVLALIIVAFNIAYLLDKYKLTHSELHDRRTEE